MVNTNGTTHYAVLIIDNGDISMLLIIPIEYFHILVSDQ